LKVTIAHWLTPSGLLISEKGLNPDVEVKMSEEDYLSGNDPQLSKAIEIIRDM
jgi:C-terminal processing protease CtpA/Prc